MKKLTKNILAGLSGIALVLFPQLGLTESENNTSDESGSADDAIYIMLLN